MRPKGRAMRTTALISQTKLRGALTALALIGAVMAPVAGHSAPPAAAPASGLSADDQALVAQAAAYLDGFNELKGRFTQTDARGAVTSGTLYLKRPGYARFAYDPPSSLLVVADGRNVSI